MHFDRSTSAAQVCCPAHIRSARLPACCLWYLRSMHLGPMQGLASLVQEVSAARMAVVKPTGTHSRRPLERAAKVLHPPDFIAHRVAYPNH
jgi:hypothetical protein